MLLKIQTLFLFPEILRLPLKIHKISPLLTSSFVLTPVVLSGYSVQEGAHHVIYRSASSQIKLQIEPWKLQFFGFYLSHGEEAMRDFYLTLNRLNI